jgi:hypothetical protein
MIEHPASGLCPENRSVTGREFWEMLRLKIGGFAEKGFGGSSILRIINERLCACQ